MITRIKFIAVAALILWAAAASFGAISKWRAANAAESNLSAKAKAHAKTIDMLADSKSRVAYLEGLLAAAEAERRAFKKTINESAVVVANLKKRARDLEDGVMVIESIDCKKCAATHALPISTENEYRYCGTPDAWAIPLEVEIYEKYDQAIIGPYEDAARLCSRELAGSIKLHPVRFNIEAAAGLGMNGQFGLLALFAETGKRTIFSLGVGIPVDVDPMGATRINPAIIWKMERRLWPN